MKPSVLSYGMSEWMSTSVGGKTMDSVWAGYEVENEVVMVLCIPSVYVSRMGESPAEEARERSQVLLWGDTSNKSFL